MVPSPFRWLGRGSVALSSGCLHYLEPEEVQAVLLHEVGHHVRANRLTAPGGWTLVDITLHALLFVPLGYLPCLGLLALFIATIHWCLRFAVAVLTSWASQPTELACDRFAADHVGVVPMVNALLKLGEETELTEAVATWAARDLLEVKYVEMEDIHEAFLDCRPPGRIFHEHLIHHAAEVTDSMLKVFGPRRKAKRGKPYRNPGLVAFLESRRDRLAQRVRWRRFDGDGNGCLTLEEISRLCQFLRDEPECVLVQAEQEIHPTSHPSFRERVLALSTAASVSGSKKSKSAG